jgi:hypothetical protein
MGNHFQQGGYSRVGPNVTQSSPNFLAGGDVVQHIASSNFASGSNLTDQLLWNANATAGQIISYEDFALNNPVMVQQCICEGEFHTGHCAWATRR